MDDIHQGQRHMYRFGDWNQLLIQAVTDDCDVVVHLKGMDGVDAGARFEKGHP